MTTISFSAGWGDLRRHGDSEVRPGDRDHAVNVLAGGPPPWLSAALADTDVSCYPDAAEASGAIAALHGRAPEEVVITNGAAEALWLLGPALRPRSVALLQPGFSETEAALRAYAIPADHYSSTLAVPADAECVVVTNPTSPDGSLRARADLLALRRPGRTVVVDEAFMSMVPGEAQSLAGWSLPDVIVVRSMTKLLSVPGLRVGYALAPAHLAERLISVRPPWSANALALQVLVTAAAHRGEMAALADRAMTERIDLTERLEQIPQLSVHPSHTNFVLIEVPDGPRLIGGLRARAIAVRPAATFPGFGPNHIRLTARDSATNARLVAAIEAAL
jgi:histidinol-phosphate aminotransferase